MENRVEEALEAGVVEVLAEQGWTGGVELTRIPGGASRETWLIVIGEERFVLRRDPPGSESLVDQEGEAHLIRLAAEHGVPAPEVLHFEPANGRFGTPGILMEHVGGESVAPRLLRKPEFEGARAILPAQLGEALAKIHAIPIEATGLQEPGGEAVEDRIEEWERMLDEISEPLPAIEAGLRWLRANAPPPTRTALVHGDFRLGNFILDGDGLRAVIDWELAHLGDPVEDIGWLCIRSWRFGNDDLPVAGVGALEPFLDAYVRAGGSQPEPERLRFWEVFGNLKWAVICARQANDHLNGVRRSHELASLGRRICEPEWDMLELIGASA
jgi:aminoglycoside phosphotransferase (APT) family kinase protein